MAHFSFAKYNFATLSRIRKLWDCENS